MPAMRFWQVFKKNSFYYLLFLPVALYLIVFKYIPMIRLVISFKDVKPYMYVFEKLAAPFVGFKHFILFFHSFFFWDVMENTIMISL